MSRILLLHWDPDEADGRAAKLREAGHDVDVLARRPDPKRMERACAKKPDVCIVDLARRPATGRDLGVWMRQRKSTRLIPLVFVEGDEETTDGVRQVLPDAEYSDWKHVRGAIRRAVRRAIGKPATPGMLAGYSGTPLPKKLGIREGRSVALVGAPEDFDLGTLPDGVRVKHRAGGSADVVLLFVRTQAELAKRFAAAARTVADGGRLWLVWPKKTSPLAGDLGQTEVRAFGLEAGWVDYKIAALSADWSGLCFARREK
jgi:CheY-like chemotaxis protein